MFVFSAVLIYLVWAMYMQSDMVSVEDAEVVIVGGGISGLSAAVALQVKIHFVFGLHCFSPGIKRYILFWDCTVLVWLKEAGVQVVLLEARERLGGRICTVQVGKQL